MEGHLKKRSPALPVRSGRSWELGPASSSSSRGATTVQVVALSESTSASPSFMISCFGSVDSVVGGRGAFFTFSAKVSLLSVTALSLSPPLFFLCYGTCSTSGRYRSNADTSFVGPGPLSGGSDSPVGRSPQKVGDVRLFKTWVHRPQPGLSCVGPFQKGPRRVLSGQFV